MLRFISQNLIVYFNLMISRFRHLYFCAFLVSLILLSQKVSADNKPVDVVFCMDLSGSTNGLIDDLRDRMWDIIIQLQSVKPAPNLRIGFVAYSRPSFGKTTGYVKVVSPLTGDFEQLSFDLFNIRPYIEKGDQLVGAALEMTVKSMNWTRESEAVKMIFLIGNGGVQLGSVDFRAACDEATAKHISIHPIFCTKANKSKEITGWLEIARLSGTEMKEIHVHQTVPLDPVCKNIPALKEANDRLIKSYIYYGDAGFSKLKLLKISDSNAMLAGVLCFEARVNYKLRNLPIQDHWDLVDYMKRYGDLPKFDHNTLADTLRMIPDDNLKRTVLKAKDLRVKALIDINNLLPPDRQDQIKKQLVEKNLEKAETLEIIVVEAYFKMLKSKGFVIY